VSLADVPYLPAILAVLEEGPNGERYVLILLRRLIAGETIEEAWSGFAQDVEQAELWGMC